MGYPPRIPVWLPLEKEVVYFLTFCVKHRRPVLANEVVLEALRSAVARLEHWWVYAAILMPDHVHVLAAPDDREADVGNLSGALKRWIRMEMRHCSNCLFMWVGMWGLEGCGSVG